MRQFDWVVFGLVDRHEFDLRHFRCPFLSAHPDILEDSIAAHEGSEGDAGGARVGRVLQIDAVIVTDRELMYDLDRGALQTILSKPWTRELDSLSFDHAIIVAWVLEPPVITSTSYENIRAKMLDFDLVFSHNEAFLNELPISCGQYYPFGTSLIPPHQRGMHSKSKLVSILASARAHAPGHELRHAIVRELGRRPAGLDVGGPVLDAFGQAFDGQVVANKADTLVQYMFSFAIENSQVEGYFTEKLIDCFLTGTIPIYWGPASVIYYILRH